MRRFIDPALFVFAAALILSLAFHLVSYGALSVLAVLQALEERPGSGEPAMVELDFEPLGDPPAAEDPEPEPESEPESSPAPSAQAPSAPPESEPEPTPRRPEREPAREPEPEPEPEVPVEAQPAPSPAETRNLQAVEARSQNPDVPPPEAPRFIAEENSRVEEETAARLRNMIRDDADPQPGDPSRSEEPEPGNADEQEVADMRELEGSDDRDPTPEEATRERPERAPDEPLPAMEASGDTATQGEQRERAGDEREQEPTDQGRQGGGEPEPEEVVIEDAFGSLRIRPPRPVGEGAGEQGGETRAGAEERRRAQRQRRGQRGEGAGHTDIGPPRRIAWADLDRILGEENLEAEREQYIRERRSKQRGSNRDRRWREFRAALENFTPTVQPGNQTALNTAASPFATYLAAVHRRIHRQFADRFLAGLPTWSTNPYADRSLRTDLEIILNRDGTVHRVGIVSTSGYLPFDYGAFDSVMRGQPYPEPPVAILSGDSRVYFHWGFYRNERQCGTFNASPYILPNPPGAPARSGGPMQDRPAQGGIIPSDARPTWGLPGQAPAGGGAETEEGSGDEDTEPEPPPAREPEEPPAAPAAEPGEDEVVG